MFELLKVEKIIIFSKKLRVRIIRASELIEDIRYTISVHVNHYATLHEPLHDKTRHQHH